MKTTRVLIYPDHEDEIASLNLMLSKLQKGEPRPELKPYIDELLERINVLMSDQWRLEPYDQRVRP